MKQKGSMQLPNPELKLCVAELLCRFFLHGVSKPIEKSQNDAPKQLDHQFLLGGSSKIPTQTKKKNTSFWVGFLLAHQPKPFLVFLSCSPKTTGK